MKSEIISIGRGEQEHKVCVVKKGAIGKAFDGPLLIPCSPVHHASAFRYRIPWRTNFNVLQSTTGSATIYRSIIGFTGTKGNY